MQWRPEQFWNSVEYKPPTIDNQDKNELIKNSELEKIKVELLWEESYNQFLKAIENKKWTELYNKLINLIWNEEDLWELKYYISKKWYPITNNWILILLEDFWVKVEEEDEKQDKEDEKQDKEDEKQGKIYLEAFGNYEKKINKLKKVFKWNIIWENFVLLIQEWIDNKNNISKFDKIKDKINDFLLEDNNLNNLMITLAKQAKESWDYSTFESTRMFITETYPDISIPSLDFYIDLASGKTTEITNLESIVGDIESDNFGVFSIDLDNVPPKTKLSLLGWGYSFEEKIDSEGVNESIDRYLEKEWVINDGLKSLSWFSNWFNNLIKDLKTVWKEEKNDSKNKDEFEKNLKDWFQANINKFILNAFSKMNSLYEDFEIPEDIKITKLDFSELIENPNKMQDKIDSIKNKITSINEFINEKSNKNKKEYEDDIKNIIYINKKDEKIKLKTLNIINIAGWGLFNKTLLDKIILKINNISDQERFSLWFDTDINYSEWNLWFSDKYWISQQRKKLWEFFNWIISWESNQPLNIDNIAKWYVWYWEDYWNIKIQIAKIWKIEWINKAIENLKKSKK